MRWNLCTLWRAPRLSYHNFHVVLWPAHYTGRKSDDWQGLYVDDVDFVLIIEPALQVLPYPLVVLGCCCFICLLIVFPIWLWDTKAPIVGLYVYQWPAGSFIPSVLTTFGLLTSIRSYFYSPNDILMFSLYIVCWVNQQTISCSLLAHNLMSFI